MFQLICLSSSVHLLTVGLLEQSCWQVWDLQTSFSQPQTSPRFTSVSSCVTYLWVEVWLHKNYTLGGKKAISLLQSAISLYISRIEYPHRSSRESFYVIQCAPACHFLEKIGCWKFGSSPQCITECFLQPGEQPDTQTTSVLKLWFFFSPPSSCESLWKALTHFRHVS